VTTVTTVGFREVQPLSDEGRAFTIVLIILGVGTLFYTLTSVVQFFIEGELLAILGVRRMKGQIESLRDHYILCGFGRVGEEIAREFNERRILFVVVESNPEAIGRVQRHGYLLVEGDAVTDSTLLAAGIQRARCLLAASDSDAGNTFIVLTAKALNPNVYIIARAGYPESEPRMLRAGADRVVSPYGLAGRRMALTAVQPIVLDFIDTLATRRGEAILAELEISRESGLAGQTIHDVLQACPSAVVLGLQQASGAIQVGPRADTVLAEGDRLIVMGGESELEAIRTPLAGVKREAS
jgi:voltage-gated potassium channel